MDEAFIQMEKSLDEFEVQRHAYNLFKKDEMEVLTNTRIVKQDVSDICEALEMLMAMFKNQEQAIQELKMHNAANAFNTSAHLYG